MHITCLGGQLHNMFSAGAYLGEIAPMASAEIAPLFKHMTAKKIITITSAKNIMILPAFVCLWLTKDINIF